jgi:hypothetical protein
MSDLAKAPAAIERWRTDCNLIDVDLLLDIAEAAAKFVAECERVGGCHFPPKPYTELRAALARLGEQKS